MANNVRWHVHVLRREDGHAWRMALDFDVVGQRKRGRLKRSLKNSVGVRKCEGLLVKGRSTLLNEVEC